MRVGPFPGAVSLLGALALVACSSGGQAADGGLPGVTPDPASDGAVAGPDGSPGDLAVTPPAECPCPADSYCNLASNTCKLGCLAADGCSSGHYCDLPNRQCKPGCPDDNACGAMVCDDATHQCITGCRSCGKSGAICQDDSVCDPSQTDDTSAQTGCFASQCATTTAMCNGFWAPDYGFIYHAPGVNSDFADDCQCSGNQLVVTVISGNPPQTYSCIKGCEVWTSPSGQGGGKVNTHYGCF